MMIHLSQRTVTPSLLAFRSRSSRNCGSASSNLSVGSLKIDRSSPAMKSLMTPSFFRNLNDFRRPTQSAPPLPEEAILYVFNHFNLDVPVRLTATGAHFEPVPYFGLHFPQHFLTRRGGHSNRTWIHTRMFCAPLAALPGKLTDKSHSHRG